MAKITQIKQNVKNKNKASVFADGEFLCSVTCESIVNGRLKEGDEIDEAKLKLVLEESEKQLAFQKGVESRLYPFGLVAEIEPAAPFQEVFGSLHHIVYVGADLAAAVSHGVNVCRLAPAE